MEPIFSALSLYKKRQFEECVKTCTELLDKNPFDQVNCPSLFLFKGAFILCIMQTILLQAVWVLKMKALTEQLYVDDMEAEEEGIAEAFMDNETIAESARPGTSLKNPGTSQGGSTQGYRLAPLCIIIWILRQ